MKNFKELSIEDQCMVHRYLYYVKSRQIISDREYDMLERDAVMKADENHPIHNPGSSLEWSYDKEIIEIANSL